MPGRKFTSADYRFSVNGTEKSPEIGSGHNTTYFRELDSRTGRWWSTDPVWHPWESPYATFANNPIFYADPSGADPTDPPGGPDGSGGDAGSGGSSGGDGGSSEAEEKGTGSGSPLPNAGNSPSGSSGSGELWSKVKVMISEVKRCTIPTKVYTYRSGAASGAEKRKDAESNPDDYEFTSGEGHYRLERGEVKGLFYPNTGVEAKDRLSTPTLISEMHMYAWLFAGETANQQIQHFIDGGGTDLVFSTKHKLSQEISKDERFTNFAEEFEKRVLNHLIAKGDLEDFDGDLVLSDVKLEENLNFGGFGNLYLATAVGGVQGVKVDIEIVSSDQIVFRYTIYDTFGAGIRDANNKLGKWWTPGAFFIDRNEYYPGLQEMFILQHYRRNGVYKNMFQPYYEAIRLQSRSGSYGR